MKTEENNKIIAEFMGIKEETFYYIPEHEEIRFIPFEHGLAERISHFNAEELKYNSSWEWLMPVVEKIETIEGEDRYCITVEIDNKLCLIRDDASELAIGMAETKIQATYKAVVEFIKWYNQQEAPNDITPAKLENSVLELSLRTLKNQMQDAKGGQYDIFLAVINNALNEQN